MLIFSLVSWLFVAISSQAPAPNEHIFEQQLDHFNPQNLQTFPQRYFTSDIFYNPQNGTLSTIFFYCGGEGDLEEFWNNTGLPFDIATQFNAFIVFAEHRYYGQSLSNISSTDSSYFKYLSMEQAIADFAVIINHIKTSNIYPHLQTSPVITFYPLYYASTTHHYFRLRLLRLLRGYN